MAITNIFTEVERSIYEALRLRTVAEGYTPDISQYPNTSAGTEQYRLDLAAIKADKGFAVEIFNNTQPEAKGVIQTARISIVHGGTSMGNIGLPIQQDPIDMGDGTSGLTIGSTITNEYQYEVFLTADGLDEFRVIQGIVLQALTGRSFIEFHGVVPTQRFLNIMLSGFPSPSELRGFKEFVYAFRVPDLLTSVQTYSEVVANMQEYNLEITKYLGI